MTYASLHSNSAVAGSLVPRGASCGASGTTIKAQLRKHLGFE
jgi:hypothetical protein